MRVFVLIGAAALLGGTTLSGCATISQDKCEAGNWETLGYKDGTRGVRRDKIASYADTCAKYGISLNPQEYLAGFNAGLPTYCTYERGFALGENGSSYNQVCTGPLAVDFAPGYDAGRIIYGIVQEHRQLVKAYEGAVDDIVGTNTRLETEDLTAEDTTRLRKKLRRFRRDAENLRIDIRAFERVHNLPRYVFD